MAGDINMGFNFSPKFQKPFTDREVVVDIAERDAIPVIQRYNLMVVKTEDTGVSYILRVGYNSPDLSDNLNWRYFVKERFIDLIDTPVTYSGQAGYTPKVNAVETGLEFIDLKTEFFQKTDFIDISSGAIDAAKPVVLTASGVISSTMLAIDSGFHFQGTFTPTAGTEYPDITGLPMGSFWDTVGLDAITGYTFTGGDLAGETVFNGQFMIIADDGWSIKITDMNPALYYKLDGSQAITNDFNAGTNNIINVIDHVDFNSQPNTQAVTIGQLKRLQADDVGAAWETHGHQISEVQDLFAQLNSKAAKIETYLLDGSNPLEADLDVNTHQIKNVVDGVQVTDAATLGQVSNMLSGLDKGDVGLGNVDNTSDADKPISTDTQASLDKKQSIQTGAFTVTTDGWLKVARFDGNAEGRYKVIVKTINLGAKGSTSEFTFTISSEMSPNKLKNIVVSNKGNHIVTLGIINDSDYFLVLDVRRITGIDYTVSITMEALSNESIFTIEQDAPPSSSLVPLESFRCDGGVSFSEPIGICTDSNSSYGLKVVSTPFEVIENGYNIRVAVFADSSDNYSIPAGVHDTGFRDTLSINALADTPDFNGLLDHQRALHIQYGTYNDIGTGIIGTAIGLNLSFLDPKDAVGTAWSIYSAGDIPAYFEGSMQLGTFDNTEKLTVNGNVLADNITLNYDENNITLNHPEFLVNGNLGIKETLLWLYNKVEELENRLTAAGL